MPDGDVIRGISGVYHQPYQDLVEGKATDSECIKSILKALQKDLKKKGNVPIQLAKEMAIKLGSVSSQVSFLNAHDHSQLSFELEQLVKNANGSPRTKGLVLRAGKKILIDLKYGDLLAKSSCYSEIVINQYMVEVFEAEFNQALPLAIVGDDISLSKIQARIENINPQVFKTIEQWSQKANTDSSVMKIRMHNLPKPREVDLEEDLLSGAML